MIKKNLLLILFALLVTLSLGFAHGSNITFTTITSYQLQGTYDDGSPMAQAQVTIFSPNEPEKPWLKALADDQGGFLLNPDPTLPGQWTIQFRSGGHGDMITIDTEASITSAKPLMPLWQKGLIALSILWGMVGTSLYFRKGDQ